MSNCTLSRIVGIGALGALTLAADAAVSAYEGYDGNSIGFATNFSPAGGSAGSQVAGLNYGPLLTSGFAREGGAAWANRGVLPQYVDSGTLWMSWLFKTSAPASSWNRLLTATNGDIIGGNERYNLGYTGDGFTVRGVFGTTAPTSNWQTSLTDNSTYMFVARYDFGAPNTADGTITLWVNPDFSALGTGSTPTGGHQISVSGISDDAMNFNAVGFYGDPQPGTSPSTFDELRLGATWIDVSPTVPEPATITLAAASSLLCLRRRRA